jgi:hypothetical protein
MRSSTAAVQPIVGRVSDPRAERASILAQVFAAADADKACEARENEAPMAGWDCGACGQGSFRFAFSREPAESSWPAGARVDP